MSDQAGIKLVGRNPDILTCIANLSNDEVFTPPEFANQMLDALAEAWAADHSGASIWSDKSVRFLDPCAKSGVFLREITSRLICGLEKEIPDLQERVEHILTEQVYGIALTKLTAMMSRRSLYCSKYARGVHSISRLFSTDDGNVWWQPRSHSWINGKCRYCGASQQMLGRDEQLETHAYAFIHAANAGDQVAECFGDALQFDVVIGNPPYQLGDGGGGGGASATPIYNIFVEAALDLKPRYVVMVTPSRWFSGGKGLEDFRRRMLTDGGIMKLVDFPQLYDVFPGVKIRGGISYWVWSSKHNGPCEVVTMVDNQKVGESSVRRLDAYDVLVRRNEAVVILDKVSGYKHNGQPEHSLGDQVSARKPFGLTNQRGNANELGLSKPIRVYGNQTITYMESSMITLNTEWIDKWKVLSVKAHGTSGREDKTILGAPIVAGPGTACTETYLVIHVCDSESEANNVAVYLRTRFARFLVSLRKITQNITRDSYKFVPVQDWKETWTDEMLYSKYGITLEEQRFIESQIRAFDGNLFSERTDEQF